MGVGVGVVLGGRLEEGEDKLDFDFSFLFALLLGFFLTGVVLFFFFFGCFCFLFLLSFFFFVWIFVFLCFDFILEDIWGKSWEGKKLGHWGVFAFKINNKKNCEV